MPSPDNTLADQLALRRKLLGARRKRTRVPKARTPRALVLAYAKELRTIATEVAAELEAVVTAAIPRLVDLAPLPRADTYRFETHPSGVYLVRTGADARRTDAPLDEYITRLAAELEAAVARIVPPERAAEVAARIGRGVSAFNREQLDKQFLAVLGIQLPRGGTAEGDQLGLFQRSNVDLIKGLAEEQRKRVQAMVDRTVRTGVRAEDLAAQLQSELGFGEARAELIARDQVLKFNGELTELRQRELGVERYEWVTSSDERVRPRHAELSGRIFRWDDPPVINAKGDRGHPGTDIQCRCVANPIIELPEE